jgi:hypothetical protein
MRCEKTAAEAVMRCIVFDPGYCFQQLSGAFFMCRWDHVAKKLVAFAARTSMRMNRLPSEPDPWTAELFSEAFCPYSLAELQHNTARDSAGFRSSAQRGLLSPSGRVVQDQFQRLSS